MFGRLMSTLAGVLFMLGLLGLESATLHAIVPTASRAASGAQAMTLVHAGAIATRALTQQALATAERAVTPVVASVLGSATEFAAATEGAFGVGTPRGCIRLRAIPCRTVGCARSVRVLMAVPS